MSNYNTLSQTEREKAVYRYIRALDNGDANELSHILSLAESDVELDGLITDLHFAYEEELLTANGRDDTQIVQTILEKHFSDATNDDLVRKGQLTVSDVAKRLEQERQVPGQDLNANRRILQSILPLPANFAMNSIRHLAQTLGVTASDRYWRAFRNAAIIMQMAEEGDHASQLAAARQQKDGRKGKDSK